MVQVSLINLVQHKSASLCPPNNPPTISDDRYYWNNHYAIIKSSVATTTFNGSYNATLIGTYNGNYYYMSDNSTSWDNQKSRFQHLTVMFDYRYNGRA